MEWSKDKGYFTPPEWVLTMFGLIPDGFLIGLGLGIIGAAIVPQVWEKFLSRARDAELVVEHDINLSSKERIRRNIKSFYCLELNDLKPEGVFIIKTIVFVSFERKISMNTKYEISISGGAPHSMIGFDMDHIVLAFDGSVRGQTFTVAARLK